MNKPHRRIFTVADQLYGSLLHHRMRLLDRIQDHLLGLMEFQKELQTQMKTVQYLRRPDRVLFTEPPLIHQFQLLRRQIRWQLNRIPEEEELEWPEPCYQLLVDELRALDGEFGNWEYHTANHVLSVTTDPIVLEDVHLGPFSICLRVDGLRGKRYEIVALEPNCPHGREDVPHPHVADGVLCEGEATTAIAKALTEGRIYDFFTIVRSVLTTYNPNSPHIRLDKWDGINCQECGCTISDDESYGCTDCESTTCGDCNSCCHTCDNGFCHSCLGHCHHCDENLCKNCAANCAGCDTDHCPQCLTQCPECEKRFCEDCTATCRECGAIHCSSCLEDELCVGCRQPATVTEEKE